MFQINPSDGGQGLQLFCIAHAGAGPSAFRGWSSDLQPEIEPILVELPGRETRYREKPLDSIQEMVGILAEATINRLEGNHSFAFFGNSMGAIVAFETLHEIKRRTGQDGQHLFVSASNAPHRPQPLPPISELPDDSFVSELCTRYDGIPSAVLAHEEFLAAVLPTLRADIRVVERYFCSHPRPLDCPITAFGGRRDFTVPVEDLEAWSDQTRFSFHLHLLDEGHLYLQSARAHLTDAIRETLWSASCSLLG